MTEGISTGRLDLDHPERFQRLRAELGVTALGLNLMVLRPGQRGRVHRHRQQEEVYVVLRGVLSVLLDDEVEHPLGPHDLMRVAPDVRRQLVNRGPETVAFLALGASGTHEGRDGEAWASWADDGPPRPPQEIPLPDDLPPDERR
jgi:uncharacterized cupin superfamily protein